MITHDRWQRIKEIFQSAQEKSPAERLEFLNEVCGDDESIREEVEALLTADDSNDDFLSIPAYEFAACVLADEKGDLEFEAGQKVGRYTILWPLAAGGMGQIYLAQDEQLGRKIALKLIAREFATDPRRVLRFEQEARAASALNHPNVCVIHETGVTDNNRHFIAMEHVQGTTLRDKLTREPLSLLEALHIARQVADALAAAHAAGIVHRDIKPENIMLRPDGYVKVLDFGLAKLTERLAKQAFPPNVHTEAGTLMGTVKYMSPEQLRESELDERTDIWSLGVVLYEMITRTTPFEARTPADTIARIVGPQTPSLTLPTHVPARFREIVEKALEKDRGDRYQTVTKLGSDLYALQRELERQSENGLLPQPGQAPIFWHSTPSTQQTRTQATGSTLNRLKSQAILTADFLFTGIRSHKAATLASMTAVLFLLFYLPSFFSWVTTKSPAAMKMNSVTNSGTSVVSAVTRDGKLVAHAEEENGLQKLMLTSTSTQGYRILVPPDEVRYLGVTFAPDNLNIYFTREEKDGAHVLYRMPIYSGTPVKVNDDVDGPVSFSPQGNQFAFVRLDDAKDEYGLFVSDAFFEGHEHLIATRKGRETFSTTGVSWSPDGNTIVCPAGRWNDGFRTVLVAFSLAGGTQRVIGEQSWFTVYQVAWENDSSLVISARAPDAMQHQLWRVSYPEGEAQRITHDLSDYQSVSIAGDKIVTVRQERSWRLWVADLDDFDNARSIAFGTGFGYGVSWSPKGELIYSAVVQDRLTISRIALDGSYKIQLTKEGDNYQPAVSSDGRVVVFSSNRLGSFDIWSINAEDGGDAKRLTFSDGNFYPSLSPDNQWVGYDNLTDSKASVWKVPLHGGMPVKIANRFRMPVFSPDNGRIAVRYEELESGAKDVAIYPAQGGEATRKLSIQRMEWQRVRWMNDHTLTYLKSVRGTSNIWSYDLDTNTEKQLTHFNSEQIYSYDWSPDFKQVACQRGRKVSDVTIISSER